MKPSCHNTTSLVAVLYHLHAKHDSHEAVWGGEVGVGLDALFGQVPCLLLIPQGRGED